MTPDEVVAAIEATAPFREHRVIKDAPTIASSIYRSAAGGTIATGLEDVPGVAAKKAYGVAVLDVEIGSLWAGINDTTAHPGYTATAYSEIVRGERCASGRYVFQFLPIAMATDRWWITVLTGNEAIAAASAGSVRELSWTSSDDATLITSEKGLEAVGQGIPIAFTKGAYLLVKLDDLHTLMEYYVWTDPGGSIPAGMASWFASSSVTDAIEAMERFAKDGKSRCPRG